MEKSLTDYHYKQFVGKYAKRFYNPFEFKDYAKIVGFRLKPIPILNLDTREHSNVFLAYFIVRDNEEAWEWDVEDCVIISDEPHEDPRVVYVGDPKFIGDNPYQNEE